MWVIEFNRDKEDIKSKLAEYGERFLIFNSSGDVELFVKQKYKK